MARRILLADDSVTAQNMGRRILHDAGYEVATVNNGSAALKRIAEQKPDLIILDVYMPGYGGLEVCSRLKENRETARIPVLLTVGKLEPFKPEEARRVRADAYIVKPFEASELLTALTKLEDKIVPGPEPYKPGRFAKAIAAVEQDTEDFGDKESGWKDRLIIPGGKKKEKEKAHEPEAEPMPAKGFRNVARDDDFRPAEPSKKFERPIPAGLPQDISAEEIAAIAAAAAKINGKAAEVEAPVVEAKAETKAWPASETPASTAASETQPVTTSSATVIQAPESTPAASTAEDAGNEEAPTATFASAPEAEPVAAARAEAAVHPEMEVVPAPAEPASEPMPADAVGSVEVPSEPAPVEEAAQTSTTPQAEAEAKPAAETTATPDRPVSDAEVLAALASLTPSGGEFAAATQAEAATLTGPRWVAEAVAVEEEEASSLLEHEMQKAYAAFAAAEAAHALPAAPVEAVMPTNGNGHAVETSSQESVVDAVATATVTPAVEEAAYAAAASAGAGEAALPEAQPVASAAPNNLNEPEEGSRVREAELAAAWANWRHIRESIVGNQPAIDAPVEEIAVPADAAAPLAAEVAAQSTTEPAPETPVEQAAPAEILTQPSAEAPVETVAEEPATVVEAAKPEPPAPEDQDRSEISNIVDNMLAELKPKLMEELKRKLKK